MNLSDQFIKILSTAKNTQVWTSGRIETLAE